MRIVILVFAGLIYCVSGQYGTGENLAQCTLYADKSVTCTGRLRCRTSDVTPSVNLDRDCPRQLRAASGTWNEDQGVVPRSLIDRGSRSAAQLATCTFTARNRQGTFECRGTDGNTWRGEYTGSVNTAFNLGLPTSDSNRGQDDPYTRDNTYDRDRDRGSTGQDRDYGRDRDRDYNNRDRDNYNNNRDRDYGRDRDRNYDRDDYNTGRRGTPYSGVDNSVDRDRNTNYGRDGRFSQHTSGVDSYDSSRTNAEIIMCTYMNDGKVNCRDCTERVERVTQPDPMTKRHYTCTGAEKRRTWSAESGIIPNVRPDPSTAFPRRVATCIFRPDARRYECHESSTEGDCGGGYDTGAVSTRCLGGRKWTGDYEGTLF